MLIVKGNRYIYKDKVILARDIFFEPEINVAYAYFNDEEGFACRVDFNELRELPTIEVGKKYLWNGQEIRVLSMHDGLIEVTNGGPPFNVVESELEPKLEQDMPIYTIENGKMYWYKGKLVKAVNGAWGARTQVETKEGEQEIVFDSDLKEIEIEVGKTYRDTSLQDTFVTVTHVGKDYVLAETAKGNEFSFRKTDLEPVTLRRVVVEHWIAADTYEEAKTKIKEGKILEPKWVAIVDGPTDREQDLESEEGRNKRVYL